jgi:hypothetical protein
LKLHGRKRGRDVCEPVVMGTWTDPTVLDGRWDDKSTQIHATARQHGLAFVFDEVTERES